MRVAAVNVLMTFVLLGAACAGAETDAGERPAANDAAAAQPAGDPAPAAEVELVGFSFAPEAVEVAVGDAVRWTNGDATRHTVTAGVDAEPTGAFHRTFDGRGDNVVLTFTAPGEYRYFCTPHPFMHGTVTVTG